MYILGYILQCSGTKITISLSAVPILAGTHNLAVFKIYTTPLFTLDQYNYKWVSFKDGLDPVSEEGGEGLEQNGFGSFLFVMHF